MASIALLLLLLLPSHLPRATTAAVSVEATCKTIAGDDPNVHYAFCVDRGTAQGPGERRGRHQGAGGGRREAVGEERDEHGSSGHGAAGEGAAAAGAAEPGDVCERVRGGGGGAGALGGGHRGGEAGRRDDVPERQHRRGGCVRAGVRGVAGGVPVPDGEQGGAAALLRSSVHRPFAGVVRCLLKNLETIK